MVTKKEMLKILEATDFPKNKGRTNILKKGQTYSRSMVLGRVRKMFSSCDGKMCKVPSRHNEKHKALLLAAKSFLRSGAPGYGFEAVTVNKNHASAYLGLPRDKFKVLFPKLFRFLKKCFVLHFFLFFFLSYFIYLCKTIHFCSIMS